MTNPQTYYEAFQQKLYGNTLDEFTKDFKPVKHDEGEGRNSLTEQEKAIAYCEFEYEMWLLDQENNGSDRNY